MNTSYVLLIILIMAAITMSLRIIPFCCIEFFKNHKIITYLGASLPACVMVIMVVYCFKSTELIHYPYGLPVIIAVVAVIAVHLYKRNAALSIIIGTAIYGVLKYYFML